MHDVISKYSFFNMLFLLHVTLLKINETFLIKGAKFLITTPTNYKNIETIFKIVH